MAKYKVFTRGILLSCRFPEAARLGEHLFPVVWSMLHNDKEIRCRVALSRTELAIITVSLDVFNILPTVDVSDTELEAARLAAQ